MRSVVTRPTILLAVLVSILANGGRKAIAETVVNGFAWVRVGDPGNMPDATTGYGAVASSFWVGQCKVTNQQYATFLNAVAATTDPYGLYNAGMAGPGNGGIARLGVEGNWSYAALDGAAQKPVCYVSYYDAVRMANWLHNGAAVGADTEAGAYTITVNGGGTTVGSRESLAKFFVPSEDEWYKSAYYKSQGVAEGYWAYPTQSDTAPVAGAPPGGNHSGNFYSPATGFSAQPGVVDKASMDWGLNYLTDVGAYASAIGPYGTYDQGGLLWEWNEAIVSVGEPNVRGLRGGSWFYESTVYASSGFRLNNSNVRETWENDATGFRLAANVTAVPEPAGMASLVAAVMACGASLFSRNGRRRQRIGGTPKRSPLSRSNDRKTGLVKLSTQAQVLGGCCLAAIVTESAALGQDLLPTIPKSSIAVELQTIATGLTAPNQLISPRDGTGRLFIAEQPGRVRVWSGGTLLADPLLDITPDTLATGWRGLHGVAVHPNYAVTGSAGHRKLYVITSEAAGAGTADLGFSGSGGADHQSVLYEYQTAVGNPNQVDVATKREVLRVDEPGTIHGLYSMTFGTDGLLYLGVGDGAGGGDPFGLAQNPAQAHGSVLRIDVDGVNGRNGQYGIPASNPFVSGQTPGGAAAIPEVYAYGFRNPWRMGVDSATGDLYLGDVGRAVIEEINRVESGGNYAWPLKEGTFKANSDATVSTDLSGLPSGLSDPLGQYEHDEGVSVIGGTVYHGNAIPSLAGQYVFADFGHPMGSPSIDHPARLFSMSTADGTIEELQVGLDDRGFSTIGGRLPLGFGEDADGELYVLTDTGDVLKITAVPEPATWALLVAGGGVAFSAARWRRGLNRRLHPRTR